MEGVLDLYAQPYDPDEPVVCFDERPVQLVDILHEYEGSVTVDDCRKEKQVKF